MEKDLTGQLIIIGVSLASVFFVAVGVILYNKTIPVRTQVVRRPTLFFPLLFVTSAISIFLLLRDPVSFFDALINGIYILASIVLLACYGISRWSAAKDTVVQDLGRPHDALWKIVLGVLLLSAYLSSAFDGYPVMAKMLKELSGNIYWFSLGIVFLVFGVSRTKLTHQGVLLPWAFIKWNNINAYHWRGTDVQFLTLEFNPVWWIVKQTEIRVDQKDKVIVSELLEKYVPGRKKG